MTREISKPHGSGCQIALLVIAGVVILLWGAVAIDGYLHRHPGDGDARRTIERLAGISLPEDTEVFVAQRSKSDFFGDHSACFLIGVPEDEFAAVVDQIPQVDDGTRLLNGCPRDDTELDGFAWTLWHTRRPADGMSIHVYLDREKSQILLMYFLT
jgi:hypothetical protein